MDNLNLVSINGEQVPTLEILLMLTILMLLPSILIMVTSFTRIIIILSFTRNAIGVQQTPPNMVLVGIALFLTLFIMSPVLNVQVPLKEFMLKETEESALNLFINISDTEVVENPMEYSMLVIIPAFITSELKKGFLTGLLLYIPFLLIDIVVSSTLMSMGMIMLPPATIAMPFKLLLFVTVDGWQRLFEAIVAGFL